MTVLLATMQHALSWTVQHSINTLFDLHPNCSRRAARLQHSITRPFQGFPARCHSVHPPAKYACSQPDTTHPAPATTTLHWHACIAQAVNAVLAAGVALSLTLGTPNAASAAPIRLEDRRVEKETALQEQMRKLEYAFEQQQTAKRAEIVGK